MNLAGYPACFIETLQGGFFMDTIFRDRDGKPVYVTGLQAHNSSSTSPELIEKSMHAVELFGGNTLEAPVYWYRIEEEEGDYDFSTVQALIDQVRGRGLHLILLWFGVNKNGHPNYLPEYMKLKPEVYRLAIGHDGSPVPSVSVHCAATLKKDLAAFSAFIRFLKDYDGKDRTVLAVQIENEFGYCGTDRDYSELADADYEKGVPEELQGLRIADDFPYEVLSDEPLLGKAPAEHGAKSWSDAYGFWGNEAFSAWYTARFVETLAAAGKEIYPSLPYYCNIALGERGLNYPGLSYNGGAGVPRMIGIWKIAAPHLDLLCPDIYHPDKTTFTRVCADYSLPDNALFIPETAPMGDSFAMNIIEAAGNYGAVGVCGFGAEGTLDEAGNLLPEAAEVAYSMRAIAGLSPLLLKYRGTDKIHAFTQEEFTTEDTVVMGHYCVTAQYIKDNPKFLLRYSRRNRHAPEHAFFFRERGRGILIQTGEDEFYLAGSGIGIDFIRLPKAFEETVRQEPVTESGNRTTARGAAEGGAGGQTLQDPRSIYGSLASRVATQLNFLTVEEGHFEGDKWVTEYYRNGDESNFQFYAFCGQVVRIRINPFTNLV